MIREANVNDYIDIHKICCQDLGYICNADLVKERLKNLDSSREKVFVAIIDGKVVGYVHAEQYNTLYFESLVNILGLAVSKAYRRRGCGKAPSARCGKLGKGMRHTRRSAEFREGQNRGAQILSFHRV